MQNANRPLPRVLRAATLLAVVLPLVQNRAPAQQPAERPTPPVAPPPAPRLDAPLTPADVAAGWISLFDGQTLYGWQPTSDANWRVEDRAIVVDAGGQGFLMTTSEFADYELHVEFKAPATTNSGVFLRTPLAPADPANDCYELNIAPQDNPFPTTSIVGRLNTPIDAGGYIRNEEGDGYHRIDGQQMPNPWDGAWHAFDVTIQGEHVEIAIDGAILAKYFSEEDNYGLLKGKVVPRGRIGLQFREGEVAFRNVRLKPLRLKPMLNGQDLTGWRTDQTRDAKFASEGAELHITSGPGELETETSYGDFVMQLECFVDGDGLNSGVFFRSIPGDFANGYESQIQNAVKNNDPTQPVDAGTGAIYRRTTARRVVSKDREWFAKTIVATGPHIAVWVNGEQVTDWTDDRPPHDNPRNGQRTEAGTISLQAHDPTTNIRFRNLQIAELPTASP
jgi:hypothetical protein